MKYIDDEGFPTVELSERNLRVLLAKLEDPNSACTLIDPDRRIAVRAVHDEDHYADRVPGVMLVNGEYT